MNNPISSRKLSVHSINEMLISMQTLSVHELRQKNKLCCSEIKNDIKIIHMLYDDIDRVNKRYRDLMAERRYLLERCHELAREVNELRSDLSRVNICEHCETHMRSHMRSHMTHHI